jgi:hypothetical protein
MPEDQHLSLQLTAAVPQVVTSRRDSLAKLTRRLLSFRTDSQSDGNPATAPETQCRQGIVASWLAGFGSGARVQRARRRCPGRRESRRGAKRTSVEIESLMTTLRIALL